MKNGHVCNYLFLQKITAMQIFINCSNILTEILAVKSKVRLMLVDGLNGFGYAGLTEYFFVCISSVVATISLP